MLTSEEKNRYARQIMLSEIGETGQEKLGLSRVLIAGLGGLGSLVSLYLTAAGVGMLRLADRDTVSLPDLNRQILYTHADIGRIKTEAASGRLLSLNGSCRIADLIERFGEEDSHLIVEHNGRFVFVQEYATRTVSSGDRIEFINPDFGG